MSAQGARAAVRGAAVLVLYAVLVGWFARPLPARLATDLPCPWTLCHFDVIHSVWVLSWETHTLLEPARMLEGNVYHPTRHALLYGMTGFGALPWFAPVFALTGNPVLAMNVVYLGSLVLTALGFHLVVRRWTRSDAAGFVSGVVFLTNPWLWTWIATTPHNAAFLYWPWIAWLAAAPLTAAGAAALVVLLLLQSLTEPVYLAPALFAPLGVLALLRREGRGRLLAVLVAAALLLAPLYAGYAGVRAANPQLSGQTVFRSSTTPLQFAPRISRAGVEGGPLHVPWPVVAVIVLGAACLRVAGLPAGARRGWRCALVWIVTSLVLATRAIVVFGHPLELPHLSLLARIVPPMTIIRVPERLGVVAMFGIAVLAGIAVAAIGGAAARRWPGARGIVGGGIAAALLLVLARTVPALPVEPALPHDSPLLQVLAHGEGPVLELPVDPRRGAPGLRGLRPTEAATASLQARAMYRSVFHWRPILNGYLSFWPASFPGRMALAQRLPDPAALAALRDETGLTAVLVHTAELTPDELRPWLTALEGGRPDLRPAGVDGGDLLFLVPPR
jgi:hypothetical protein